MRYENVKELKDAEFKRATGVERQTFAEMLSIVQTSISVMGRPARLSAADQLLMTLMYWREYRTEFHIGLAYDVNESTVCRTIQKVENLLIGSERFHLPGKKALTSGATELEIVLIDATEQPIERPKKNSANITAARKSSIHRKPS